MPGLPMPLVSVVGLLTNTPFAALEFCVNVVTPPEPPGPAVPSFVKCAVPALAVSKKIVSPPKPQTTGGYSPGALPAGAPALLKKRSRGGGRAVVKFDARPQAAVARAAPGDKCRAGGRRAVIENDRAHRRAKE